VYVVGFQTSGSVELGGSADHHRRHNLTTTIRMTTRGDEKETTREAGRNPFPVSRVQKILKADTQLPMVSKEAVFLISVATEKFIERLTQAGQHVAQRQSRATILERDICTVVRGVEEFTFLWDVLSEPDDSYPTREPTKTRKTKDTTDSSGGIGAFFSKPPAPAADSEEDTVMNEGGAAGIESADE